MPVTSSYEILHGDVLDRLRSLPDESVHCIVTSPPYWGLRDYGIAGQLGLEATLDEYLAAMVAVCNELWRVLRKDGTLWLNIGDSYAGSGRGMNSDGTHSSDGTNDKQATNRGSILAAGFHEKARLSGAVGRAWVKPPQGYKQKDLMGVPWRLAFALQDAGWWLRSDIIWSKPNPMPESVRDRPTRAHEYIFLLTKSPKYYYDAEAIRQPAKNPADDHRRILAQHGGNKSVATEQRNGLSDKQRGHSRRHAGFNDRWNAMEKESQMSMGANRRSVWQIGTRGYKEAHFATFPPALVEMPIKAGTSEKGVCSACGKPWRRIVEKSVIFAGGSGAAKQNGETRHDAGKNLVNTQTQSGDYDIRMGPVMQSQTLGWQQACKCENAEVIPATVLDPFSGAATTGVVCLKTGRNYIGIELNAEYVEMSLRRLKQTEEELSRPPKAARSARRQAEACRYMGMVQEPFFEEETLQAARGGFV